MRHESVALLVSGVVLMVLVLVAPIDRSVTLLGLLASLCCLCLSLWEEYDANVAARRAWMKKAKIRRAELYYCEEEKE